MRQENGTSTLMADISEKQPGLYPYLITCEAEGYKPLAFAGNLTIAAPQGQYRIPSVSAAPAAQLASAGHATSYLVEVRGNSECNGTQTISLSAEPPAGWNARFEKDSLSVPCGGSRSTALTISIPENAQPGVRMIPMTAALADAPEFAKRIFVSAGLAEGAALPLSCLSGGALESQSNLAASDDPCWNWNENQTYNLGTPVAGTLYVAGESALPSCTQPVQLEGSNDSVSFTPLAQAQPEASGSFTLSSQIPAYRFVRVRSGCMLRATSLLFSPSQPQEAQQPDLLIAGVRFPAELRQGEPALATLVVRNAGPSIYSQYQSTLSMRGSDGSITPLDIVTTYSHASGQDLAVEFVFTPQALGAYELVFTADSSNDINESNESNNAFAVTGVTVSAQPSESLSVSLAPGWNAVPFLYGVPISTDCSGEALLRLGEGDYAQLDPQMLHFVSETEASDFTIAHGTAASPRTALAFGGAWYYADSGCTITYALASTPLPLRSSEAGLDVPAGGAMLTVLPWMSENTIPNVLGTCEPKRVSVWDASGQKWVEFNGAITPEMVGSVIAVRSGTPCHLG